MKSFANFEDGSNLTDISPVLTCLHSLSESNAIWDDARSKNFNSVLLKELRNKNEIPKEEGFGFAVSLRDGSCLYTSEAITYHLGYPSDWLDSQCIMNFVFHKDHITFANHLTQGLNACFIQGKRDESHLVLNTFFCRMRVYQSLHGGYSVSDRKTLYTPFKITLHIKELIVDDMCVEKSSGTLCVKATATRVLPAFTVPEEIPAMTSFSTRHTASCHFSHVDACAIPYLGYLPQDMIGYSVFDFYHIDDLPHMQDIYELVVKEHGSAFRSKPYRFKAQNGCYILLETEWSCFINPWSHKLEFVVGQHRVLKGPLDIDMFTPSKIEETSLSDEIINESQNIQRQIKSLLSQSIQSVEAQKPKRFCNKRKRELAAFVYNCIDKSLKGNKPMDTEKQIELMEERSNSDPDSIVMGDISPFREVNDPMSSPETPPTVQQLRYQDNIERFFASQPKTYSDESDEYTKNDKLSSLDDSTGSQSGSGDAAGSTSKGNLSSSQTSLNYENNNQKSGSNSSKCNMSSNTGDSGYGKSLGTETANAPSVSQAGSSQPAWVNNSAVKGATSYVESFSSCFSPTQEALSAHNRINHKHSKQHRKSKQSLGVVNISIKDNNDWSHQLDPGHKSSAQTQTLTASAVTQTEDLGLLRANEPLKTNGISDLEQKTGSCAPEASTAASNVLNPFLFPQNNFAPTPTPFYIPVMYMGNMPYFPLTSNSQPHWSFGPTPAPITTVAPTQKAAQTTCGGFQFSGFADASTVPYQSTFQKFPANENADRKSALPSLGFQTCTKSNLTSSSTDFKNVEKSKMCVGTEMLVDSARTKKEDSTEDEMQIEESQCSSFTQSSSCNSTDKDEDMDFELKKRLTEPISSKVQLTHDIAYRYQMNVTNIAEVLRRDREALKSMHQPNLVNEQLEILQRERKDENECTLKVDDDDFLMTEEAMLGLFTEDNVTEEKFFPKEADSPGSVKD